MNAKWLKHFCLKGMNRNLGFEGHFSLDMGKRHKDMGHTRKPNNLELDEAKNE